MHLASPRGKIIPVWHGVSSEDVRACSPSLVDIVALRTEDGVDAIAVQIRELVLPAQKTIGNQQAQEALESVAELLRLSWPKLRRMTLSMRNGDDLQRVGELTISAESRQVSAVAHHHPLSAGYPDRRNSQLDAEQLAYLGVPIFDPHSGAVIGVTSFRSADKKLAKSRRLREGKAVAKLLAPMVMTRTIR
jgi:hypothetical protein